MRPTILLADDHPMICATIEKLLQPSYEVVGRVADGRELVNAALELKPDLVLIDVGMPFVNGLDAARELKQKMPALKTIFLTMNRDPDITGEAFRIGASAYVLKSSMAEELLPAIRSALASGS